MCRMSVPDQRARTHVHALHDPDATVVQTLFRPPNLFGGTENHILRPHSITSGSDRTRARYLPPFSTARCTRTIASADPRQGPILWRMWCDVCGREWGKRPEHAGFGDPDEIRVDHEVKPEPTMTTLIEISRTLCAQTELRAREGDASRFHVPKTPSRRAAIIRTRTATDSLGIRDHSTLRYRTLGCDPAGAASDTQA